MTSVNNYISDSILGYYNELASADFGLKTVALDNTNTKETAATGDYKDSSNAVLTEAQTQYAKVVAAVTKLGSSATVAEKLAAADLAIVSAKAAIDTKYASVVKAAKEKATTDLATLFKDYSTDEVVKKYLDADTKAALEKEGKDAVAEASTLQELSEVLSKEYEVSKVKYTGSYRKVLTAQQSILTSIDSALKTAVGSETYLNAQTTEAGQARQDALVTLIKGYGVDVSSLPSEIAEEYAEKVLASREFEVEEEDAADKSYSKGDYVLAVEAAAELDDSVSGVKEALYNAILNEYYTEVNSLKCLEADQKTALRVNLANAAGSWSNVKDGHTFEQYLGATWDEAKKEYTVSYAYNGSNDSLVAVLENEMENASKNNTLIRSERLTNVLSAYKTKWTSEASAIKKDSTYASAIGVKKDTNGKPALKLDKFGVEGSWSVDNFVLDKSGVTDSTISDTNTVDVIALTNSNEIENTTDNTKTKTNYYNVDKILYNLVSNKASDAISIDNYVGNTNTTDAPQTVAGAKNWCSKFEGVFEKAYNAYLTKYGEEVAKKLDEVYGSDHTFITSLEDGFMDKIEDKDGLLVSSSSEITSLATTAFGNIAKVKIFDDSLSTFLKGSITTAWVKDGKTSVSEGKEYSDENVTFTDPEDDTNWTEVKVLNEPSIQDSGFYSGLVKYSATWKDSTHKAVIVKSAKAVETETADGANFAVKANKGSTFYAKVLDTKSSDSIISKVLAGKYDEDGIKAAVSSDSLIELYKEDCTNYVETVMDVLTSYVSNLTANPNANPEKLSQAQAALETANDIVKDGKFNYSGEATATKTVTVGGDDKQISEAEAKFWIDAGILVLKTDSDSDGVAESGDTLVLKTADVTTADFSISGAKSFQAYIVSLMPTYTA